MTYIENEQDFCNLHENEYSDFIKLNANNRQKNDLPNDLSSRYPFPFFLKGLLLKFCNLRMSGGIKAPTFRSGTHHIFFYFKIDKMPECQTIFDRSREVNKMALFGAVGHTHGLIVPA